MSSIEPTPKEIAEEWAAFKKKFKRHFTDEKEEEYRKQIFIKSLREVRQHNKQYKEGKTSWVMGISNFSDMTLQEKINFLKGRPTYPTRKKIAL